MKHLAIRRHRYWYTLMAAVLGLVIMAGLASIKDVQAAQEIRERGERLLTVYDRGEERVFLTSAATVGEALKLADIDVDKTDTVEPALDEDLVASDYSVNIYRSRPVTIIDGSSRQKVITSRQTPEQIAKSAGVELHPEDKTKLKMPDDMLTHGASLELSIDRATPFTLVLYGKSAEVRTQAKTIAGMLKEKDIKLEENDKLSLDTNIAIEPGMTIELWREGKQTITEEEEVAFEVEKIQDVDREVGYREVRTKGVPGKRSVTYEIEMKNGKEVSRKEIQSVVLTKPKKQVEVVGAKPAVTPYTGGGNKDSWLAASAIPRDQWGNAEWLVQKESGWNPNAVNPSSGACGLGQQLPCGKWAGAWNDPVASLNGMHGYVMGRYGSWDAAVAHSRANGWY